MPDTVERTALDAFTLNDRPVRKGQVVTLDRHQLARAVAAGAVLESDEENAALPRAELPPTLGGIDYERQVNEASQGAAERIAELRQSVTEEEAKARKAIDEHIGRVSDAAFQADSKVAGHLERVAKAGRDADEAIAALRDRVDEVRRSADAEIKAHQDRAAKGKAVKPSVTE